MPERFKARWGYDLCDHLDGLVAETGDWRKLRHDYTATRLELHVERFAKPYGEACAERGMAFTGHVWEHDWPRCAITPDPMSFAACQQYPGIDCLMNEYDEGPHAQFGNHRSNKEVGSIANQLGRERVLCEAYGAAGWETTLLDMKRIGDHLCVGGINLLDPHLRLLHHPRSAQARSSAVVLLPCSVVGGVPPLRRLLRPRLLVARVGRGEESDSADRADHDHVDVRRRARECVAAGPAWCGVPALHDGTGRRAGGVRPRQRAGDGRAGARRGRWRCTSENAATAWSCSRRGWRTSNPPRLRCSPTSPGPAARSSARSACRNTLMPRRATLPPSCRGWPASAGLRGRSPRRE